jgi:DNA-binding MarR family transcriptional regulator
MTKKSMASTSGSDVDTGISMLLVDICKQRRNVFNAALVAVGLYAGQDMLLYHLFKSANPQGMTVTELAESICVQPATVSNMIRRMEAGGMVLKTMDPVDKRIYRIRLSKVGEAAFAKVTTLWKEVHQRTVKGLSSQEQETLSALLVKVKNNVH